MKGNIDARDELVRVEMDVFNRDPLTRSQKKAISVRLWRLLVHGSE